MPSNRAAVEKYLVCEVTERPFEILVNHHALLYSYRKTLAKPLTDAEKAVKINELREEAVDAITDYLDIYYTRP